MHSTQDLDIIVQILYGLAVLVLLCITAHFQAEESKHIISPVPTFLLIKSGDGQFAKISHIPPTQAFIDRNENL